MDFNKASILNSNFNYSMYCVKYFSAWREEEGISYIKQEFCKNGDILDYLEKLEISKDFEFSSSFYWDKFFEMISVIFL